MKTIDSHKFLLRNMLYSLNELNIRSCKLRNKNFLRYIFQKEKYFFFFFFIKLNIFTRKTKLLQLVLFNELDKSGVG